MLATVFLGMTLSLSSGCQKPEDPPTIVGVDPPGGTGGAPAGGTGGADSTVDTDGGGSPDDAGSASDLAAPAVDMGGVADAPELTPTLDAAPEAPATMDAVVTPPPYPGRPWNNTPQMIPGTIHAELYDIGGEGVAYHDADPEDRGVMPTEMDRDAPEATFRIEEGVDLGSTRAGRDRYTTGMDVQARQLYVGWTNPDEWVKYTVTVVDPGSYVISALIASMADQATLSISFEDGTTTGPRPVPWTRSFYTWRFADSLATVNLTVGTHVMTVKWEAVGMVNLEYLTFVHS